MRIYDRVQRLPKGLVLATAFALVAVVGGVDSATGKEISFAIFYLIPVMLSGCVCGRGQRFLVSLFSGATSLVADRIMNPNVSELWIPYWNAAVRFGIFVVAGELTAEICERNNALRKEIAERKEAEGKLWELNATLEERVAERTEAAEKRSAQLTRSEAVLQKQAEVLHSILKSMGDGVIVADAEGKIILCNPEAERLLHLDADTSFQDWLERNQTFLPEMLASNQASNKSHPLIKALRGEIVDGAEMFIENKSSSVEGGAWVRATARPLLAQDGQPAGGVIVFNDMTARKRLEKQVAEISDRERRRIGQDLHDGVCQHLVCAALAGNLLAESLADKGLNEARQATDISNLIKEAVVQTRDLAHALCSIDLTGDGLVSALEGLADTIKTTSNIECRFTAGTELALLEDRGEATNLYRIGQEAVNNAVKHSRATEILIDLRNACGLLTLTVADNGVGLQIPGFRDRKGMGMDIMNYRARMIGASLCVEARPSGGTLVTCSIGSVNGTSHAS